MKRRILALDLGTKTGWAHSYDISGVWNLSVLRDDSHGMRLVRFETLLLEIINGPGVEIIGFEAVTAGAGPRTNFESVKFAAKLQAIVERLAETIEELECCSYNLATIKAHAIAQKGAPRDKKAMIQAATVAWPGVQIIDDNHADALWLLDLIQTELLPKGKS